MGQTKFKLLVLDEAEEDTKDLRRYIPKSFGTQTWKQTSAELAVTFGNVRHSRRAAMCRRSFRISAV
ncbi:hypothetical protein P0D69_42520 [Paraburkholderia sediminicola]|uniref:hypothetical protein n=1 Tax=Paraburkholderia sediminicola TaxID=458836 RepID=UPI0038B76B74